MRSFIFLTALGSLMSYGFGAASGAAFAGACCADGVSEAVEDLSGADAPRAEKRVDTSAYFLLVFTRRHCDDFFGDHACFGVLELFDEIALDFIGCGFQFLADAGGRGFEAFRRSQLVNRAI